MSAQYQSLIAELNSNASIPGKQLEAIMTAYPTSWGFAAPTKDKKSGKATLVTSATRIPAGWSAKDIQDMKAQFQDTPEMMEIFSKMPEATADVCMQPFPLLENDGGQTTLCLFMEGDYDHWALAEEPNHSPEYVCYRDKITPLVNKIYKMVGEDMSKLLKELGSSEFRDVLEGTYENRGVIYFLADSGASLMIEGNNPQRKDEDWGAISNEVPEIQINTDTTVEEEQVVTEPVKELSLAEKRALRQGKKPEGVHATTASPRPVTNQKDTTQAEQRIRDTALKTPTTALPSGSKGPFLFTLPATILTEADAKKWWQSETGGCPDMWKHKDKDGNWLPSHTTGLPYEKFTQGSTTRAKFNPDGTPKSGSKGFAALDDLANGKGPAATAIGPQPDAARSGPAASKIPVIPPSVRDKVVADILKLDLKSRKIMSNDEIKVAEAKHSSLLAQLKNIPQEDLWKLSYEEIDKLNTSYPNFGSVWLFHLRNYQQQAWKSSEKPNQEETGTEPVREEPEKELTLAEKRALRKQNAA